MLYLQFFKHIIVHYKLLAYKFIQLTTEESSLYVKKKKVQHYALLTCKVKRALQQTMGLYLCYVIVICISAVPQQQPLTMVFQHNYKGRQHRKCLWMQPGCSVTRNVLIQCTHFNGKKNVNLLNSCYIWLSEHLYFLILQIKWSFFYHSIRCCIAFNIFVQKIVTLVILSLQPPAS